MRKIIILLVLLLPVPGYAQSADWSRADKGLLAASTALLIVDWGQTRTIAAHPDSEHEPNIILGKHPSTGAVNTYFATAIVGNYLLADWLAPKNRKRYLIGVTAIETFVTLNNYGMGIRMSF